ncbi:MAG: hypothetical protein ACR2KT_02660 [Methylocella sp.]|nr:MAG: hypothetical protein DLM68_14440 [Hyphomicrobiales bacterium]
MTTCNNFIPAAGVPPAISLGLLNVSAIQNAIGIDGVTVNAWTVAQVASGIPKLVLTIPQAGTGTTWYASVYVQAIGALPAAYPGLTFSSDNQSDGGPIGFSVVLNELIGAATSSAASGNFGVVTLAVGAFIFYQMWVSLTDTASSTELTVELYLTSYGALAATPQLLGTIASSAIFTDIIVSTTYP